MNNFTVLFLAFIATSFCVHADKPADKAMKCGGKDFTFPDKIKTALDTCYKTLKMEKPADPAAADKKAMEMVMACPIVCAGKALGILDDAGKPVKDKVAASTKEIFPEGVVSDLNTGFTACIDKHEKSLVQKDGDCSSYNEIIECVSKNVMKVCKPE